ncbi:hypothetical protein [Streptomyces sp. NBC_00887]|uniref:hypothetical protein n=1 Tax=Streptomyces sp. NBC_00887 TaxID=2975859 RepID=UPI003863BDAD|nr:hypothetical protein OG844_00295 [Streptomyces sp. NBC_00887]WSY36355.1 hypothetical protein OG844_45305 [Streptomyces sp. NBC_00887]
MDTGDDVEANPSESGRHGRKWKTVERLLGALAALIAVIGGALWVFQWAAEDSPVEKEQNLVEQLMPGLTLDRAAEIMDDKPHYTQRLASGNRVYQYNRKWERIQLLVDPDNISVLSVGVFADSTDFRPSFPLGRKHQLTLNRTLYDEIGEPSVLFGDCGVHSGSYFEAHSLLEGAPAAIVAVGIHQSFRGDSETNPACGFKNLPGCVPHDFKAAEALTGDHTTCLTSAPEGAFRRSTPIAAFVATKQVELSDDMFQSPYVVGGGNY